MLNKRKNMKVNDCRWRNGRHVVAKRWSSKIGQAMAIASWSTAVCGGVDDGQC